MIILLKKEWIYCIISVVQKENKLQIQPKVNVPGVLTLFQKSFPLNWNKLQLFQHGKEGGLEVIKATLNLIAMLCLVQWLPKLRQA